jgi:hypothetical protein
VSVERLAFLYDLLDLPQTGERRTSYDAVDKLHGTDGTVAGEQRRPLS